LLKDKIYNPLEDGKPDFTKMVKGVTTFGENKFFKTIFAGGDDVVAEEKANKQKEID
jgi:hypothetical protein